MCCIAITSGRKLYRGLEIHNKRARCFRIFENGQIRQLYEARIINKKKKKFITVLGERHRTNNVSESFHRELNKSINKNNVNLLRLLNALREKVNLSKGRSAEAAKCWCKKMITIYND